MTYLCTTKIKIIKLEMIMKHLKIKIMSIAFMAVTTSSMAQSLNKMNWLNEPQQWEIKDGKTLVMDVPAKTDFWRISHYGFTVDDGPFCTFIVIIGVRLSAIKSD